MTTPKFGDTAALECNDGSSPAGTTLTTCGAYGVWLPNPLDMSGTPTHCGLVACPALGLGVTIGYYVPPETTKNFVAAATANATVAMGCDPSCANEIKRAVAPAVFELRCQASATMLVGGSAGGGSVTFVRVPPRVQCLITGVWNTSAVDISDVRCQCTRGTRKGDGAQAASCVPCADKTYAPLNMKHERVEVSAKA